MVGMEELSYILFAELYLHFKLHFKHSCLPNGGGQSQQQWQSILLIYFQQISDLGYKVQLQNGEHQYALIGHLQKYIICLTVYVRPAKAHMHSLIRAFMSGVNILWVLSYWLNIIWSF